MVVMTIIFQRCQARYTAVQEQLRQADLQAGMTRNGRHGISWNIMCTASTEPKHGTNLHVPSPILLLTADEEAQPVVCKEDISNTVASDAGMAQVSIFSIKMSSYQYRKSHCGDKTVVRSSYLHNGISYTGKMSSLQTPRNLSVLGPRLMKKWEDQ